MQEILVDEDGYQQFFSELARLKKFFVSNAAEASSFYQSAIGDGWHDNFAFEEAKREERCVADQIDLMLKEKNQLHIIKPTKITPNKINIGDSLELKISYSAYDSEIEKIKLTGKYIPDVNAEIKEITLNSPLGQALYLKPIKKPLSYNVGDKKIVVEVLNKIS